MQKLKEQYLCSALDKFKEMITNGECSKADIAYFCDMSMYELERRGASVGKKTWLTKKEASKELNVSTSTFDRIVLKGLIPRGKKVQRKKSLLWKDDEVEQLKRIKLLKGNN